MIVFRKARNPQQTLNDLDEYLRTVGDKPVRWLAREVQSWGEFSYDEIAALIESGQLDALIDWQERWAGVVNQTLAPMWLKAIEEASRKATKGMTVLSDSNDYVKAWVSSHGGELITLLSDESRKAISNILLRGQGLRMAPRDIAKDIRPLIGLTDRQAQANVKYKDRVYQKYLDNGLSEAKARERSEAAALKYAGKQHRYRAESIVLTENAFAYNRGAHMGVSQSIADGYMGRCEMVWTTAGTNRVCGRCMELKDTVVGYTDQSGVTIPPLHPRCRCAIMYREVGDKKPSGALKFPRQQHFSSSDENIQATNPNYNLGTPFQMNCQKCVPTYEMRMRGYDVVARPTYDLNNDSFAEEHWSVAFENPQVERGFTDSGKTDIIKRMKEWGDGARAEVYVDWADDDLAHVFVAENRNGAIHFLDPQNGELDAECYFEHAKKGFTELLRIDNLEPDKEFIKLCCKELKRNVDLGRSNRNRHASYPQKANAPKLLWGSTR